MARILVVDDDESIRRAVRKILAHEGHEVVEANDGAAALTSYRENLPDLVIMDIYMPEMDGIEATIRLQQEFPDVKLVAMSGGGYIDKTELLEREAKLGALRTLSKPFTREDVLDAVVDALGSVQ